MVVLLSIEALFLSKARKRGASAASNALGTARAVFDYELSCHAIKKTALCNQVTSGRQPSNLIQPDKYW
jgi:hypothetical protein